MARQLPLDRLGCDRQDGQLAVAFGRWKWEASERVYAYEGPWAPCCPFCLERYQHDPGFVYVRFRDDPGPPADPALDADDDPALKF